MRTKKDAFLFKQASPACRQAGQAVLTLLVFMTISVAIITAIVIMVLNNITALSAVEQGTVAYYVAETGVENALLRLLRDPTYTGETLPIDGGSVVIQVDNGIATSTATVSNSVREIQLNYVYNNNVLTITSWKEIN